jgi:uncharacterized protein involved in tolerance to divalent cations
VRLFVASLSEERARALGRRLIEGGPPATLWVLPPGRTQRLWPGAPPGDAEVVIAVLTSARWSDDVFDLITAAHTTAVPMIVMLPVEEAGRAFLEHPRWRE